MPELASIYQICNIGLETTPGTAVAANKRLSGLMIDPQPKTAIKRYRGTGYKFGTVAALNKEWVEASLSGPITYTEIVYLLSSLLDVATIATPGGGTNSRSWTFAPDSVAADAPKTFTVEIGDATRAQEFAYGLVKDLTLSFSREGNELSGTMLGNSLVDGITLTGSPTAIALMPVLPTQITVKLADTAAGLPGASALTRAVSAEWSMAKRYSPAFFLDAATSWGVHVEVEPTAKMKLKVEADSVGMGLLTQMRAGSTKFMRIGSTGSIIEGAIPYSLTIDGAGKIVSDPKFSDEDGIRCIEWEFDLFHDATWGAATQIVAVNLLTAL